MSCIALCFGAPLKVPAGKVSATTCIVVAFSCKCPVSFESSGDRMNFGFTVFDNNLGFGRRTKYFEIAIIKKEQIRRRIDASQRSINIKFVSFEILGKSSGQNQLEHIASKTMFF